MTIQDLTPALDEDRIADAALAEILFSPEGVQDPYPRYRTLRETRPVHHSKLGMWVFTSYDDVLAMLRDKAVGKNVEGFMHGRFGGQWQEHAALRRMGTSMLWANPPEHTRLRRLAGKSFTGAMVERLRDRIQHTLDELLDPIAEAGGGDIVNDVCYPLPLYTVADLLGMPREEAPALREPMRNFQRTFELGLTAQELREADEGAQFSDDYFADLIDRKRRQPGDDLVSALIAITDAESGRLSPIELIGMCNMVIGAGFETTTHMLGNGVRAFAQHPAEAHRLRADMSLLDSAIDEVIRYDAPVQIVVRTLTEPRTVGGVQIEAPAQLILGIGAANHDPAHVSRPEEFRIDRRETASVSFGAGIHTCMGWRLAKLQAEVFHSTMLRRFSAFDLQEQPVYRPRLTLRGVESLRIAVVNA
ncbi:cytochrome P450 [Streptomyces purpurogeneiscleroticus]|uniref:cytochrome P450 n=1 Tax=Streptomyces purpurogeneiscleroticus TaxID=68259 RepID=UPI001CBBB5C4|nr:cytochrome P450 [Streptomyces purpurogeneiscleroticus]MBZ4016045.1 cytochrome P450 [Streptomyces purpurogeneiscleroticus]